MELTVADHKAYVYTGTKPLLADQSSLVFVHGAGMDHSVWILQSRYFAYHGRNVLAVDLPGHGRSTGEPLPTIQSQADWLLTLLDAAQIDQAAIVGHSMGSLAALEFAANYPERTTALAMLGTAFPMLVGKPLLDAAQNNDHAAFDMITIWGVGGKAQLGGNRAPGLWMSGQALRLLERSKSGALFADLNACNEYRDGLASAAKVCCPRLLLLGQGDMMTPPKAARTLLETLNTKAVVLDGCGHMLMLERPDETLDTLIELIP